MKESEVQSLALAISNMLLSNAAHGLATGALEGTGEITLRDGLIVASAAAGARLRQAWIIDREIVPSGWTDAPVDVLLRRVGNLNAVSNIGGIELKWWRKTDSANAANRRRELITDFVRAGALYALVEDFAFVALLSTAGSWEVTAKSRGTDKDAMGKLSGTGVQKWDLKQMIGSRAISTALCSLRGRLPIPNIFHSQLLCTRTLSSESEMIAFAKVWGVKKPQKSKILQDDELDRLLQKKAQKQK